LTADDTIRERAGPALLAWYDRHARPLPWRLPPARSRAGGRPEPYRVWLSEIMLQQTTVATVTGYFEAFTRRWPRLEDLARADEAEVMAAWAGLGYYARARNMLKCAREIVETHGGRFPEEPAALQRLPGIGPYTAAAIAAIAFGRAATVVDGNVERVMARLFACPTPLPKAKPELHALAARLTPRQRPGDHAQAVMDLGATLCTPRAPRCAACPLAALCRARARGQQEALPRRLPKSPKPTRHGTAFVAIRHDGALLLERRPAKGLLGGMLGWPGCDWNGHPSPEPPLAADWRLLDGEVRHMFTHFRLRLQVYLAQNLPDVAPQRGRFIRPGDFSPADLPSLMRKVHALATAAAEAG